MKPLTMEDKEKITQIADELKPTIYALLEKHTDMREELVVRFFMCIAMDYAVLSGISPVEFLDIMRIGADVHALRTLEQQRRVVEEDQRHEEEATKVMMVRTFRGAVEGMYEQMGPDCLDKLEIDLTEALKFVMEKKGRATN